MVGRQSVRKKKRFRNKSRNKNVRKMRQIGGYESFPFTDRPLTFWEYFLGRKQKQLSDEEMLASRTAETPPNTGGSNRRKSKKSKKSKKSRKSKTRHKKNKKNY